METKQRLIQLTILLAVCALCTGCLRTRVRIDSTPQNAKVVVNDKPVGFTPVDMSYSWYWYYNFEIEKEGYQKHEEEIRFAPPFWAHFPLDFIIEILPIRVLDRRRVSFDLKPIPENLDTDKLMSR